MDQRTFSVTIANGHSVSSTPVNFFPYTLVGVKMSAGWDAASLTFCLNADGTGPLFILGIEQAFTVAASQLVMFDDFGLLFGAPSLYVCSGPSILRVNQTADRVLTLYGVQ